MKIIWIRLIAAIFLIGSIITGFGHYLGKTKEPVVCVIFGFAFIILMIVAALGDALEERIAKLENKLRDSEKNA
jgi:hypothetical protein